MTSDGLPLPSSFSGPDNDALREVGLPLMSHDDCVRLYPASGAITDFMLCAGKEEGVIDTCSVGNSFY